MTTDTATDPRLTVPRSAGTYRRATALRPGWWVHLEAVADGATDEWCQVKDTLDVGTCGIRIVTITFTQPPTGDTGDRITVNADTEAVTLTAREAKRHGLVAKEA